MLTQVVIPTNASRGKEKKEEETKSYITTIVEMKLRFSSIFSLLYQKTLPRKMSKLNPLSTNMV